jgi:hypothetical protein
MVCATRTEARAARRAGLRAEVAGIGATRTLPEGPLVSFGLAGALHDGFRLGDVVDATRVVDAEGTVLWEGGPLGARGARQATVVATTSVADDPAARRALHERSGADVATRRRSRSALWPASSTPKARSRSPEPCARLCARGRQCAPWRASAARCEDWRG